LAVEAEDEDTFVEAQSELEGLIEQLEVRVSTPVRKSLMRESSKT